MIRRFVRALSAVVAAVAVGCAEAPAPPSPGPPPTLASPFQGYASRHYEDPSAWLCLPGRQDACAQNLDATELRPDGSRAVVRDVPLPGRDAVDCFYVYPTVDLRLAASNHVDFSDLSPMTRATVSQAARLRNVCRLFVPLYRQATIGAYLRSPEVRDGYLDVAASDVLDAFAHYLSTYNDGRKVVLVGHSQGAEMVTRILRRVFDGDPAMRQKLLLALPIGGQLEVPRGAVVGGTFKHVPLCSQPGETGCVVGYRSHTAGFPVEAGGYAPPPGHETVCVNPAELDRGAGRRFSRSFFPTLGQVRGQMHGVDGVVTPFVLYRDFYRGTCTDGPDGYRYLAVSVDPLGGDVRPSLFELGSRWFRGKLGLHVLDFQFAQGDLVDLVAARVSAPH